MSQKPQKLKNKIRGSDTTILVETDTLQNENLWDPEYKEDVYVVYARPNNGVSVEQAVERIREQIYKIDCDLNKIETIDNITNYNVLIEIQLRGAS